VWSKRGANVGDRARDNLFLIEGGDADLDVHGVRAALMLR